MRIASKKIAIGLSGGVDSAVAAKILKDEGHDLVGFFLKLWNDPTCSVKGENRCCDYEALADARAVAKSLDIPFYVINAEVEFKKLIVDNFIDEYKKMRTPNPCILCNQFIKFDLMLKKALSVGCDYLATGHYVRVLYSEMINDQFPIFNEFSNKEMSKKLQATGYKLLTGVDKTKDQSYMLYRLNQEQLSHVVFPLGEMTKKEVRALAVKYDLPVKEKAESQEICFFGDKDYRDFLRRYLPEEYFTTGDIVDIKGNLLGRHDGLINYTIGQRKGIEQLSAASFQLSGGKQPLYVIGYHIEKNQLIVGDDKEVYKDGMIVGDLNWISSDCHSELVSESLKVKIRYRHEAVNCRIKNYELGSKNIEVEFDASQRAITPGQSAVFYVGEEVIGGGIIK